MTFTRWLEDHRDEIEQPSVLARAQASEVRVIMRWPNTERTVANAAPSLGKWKAAEFPLAAISDGCTAASVIAAGERARFASPLVYI